MKIKKFVFGSAIFDGFFLKIFLLVKTQDNDYKGLNNVKFGF